MKGLYSAPSVSYLALNSDSTLLSLDAYCKDITTCAMVIETWPELCSIYTGLNQYIETYTGFRFEQRLDY